VGRLETTGSEAASGRCDSSEGEERSNLAGQLLDVLVRALKLERAIILLAEAPAGPLVVVAAHGRVRLHALEPDEPPGDGPWSAVLPFRSGGRTTGLLLVDRSRGTSLAPGDRALAERLIEATGLAVEHARLAVDLGRAQVLLARADRLSVLGTLAAGVAHEIRNPLVSVRTFIQLLPERERDPEFRTTFRELALGEIERICGLINDLLAFSRPAPAEFEASDINALTGQIVRLLDAEARKRDVTIACTLDEALPPVVVDPGQVKQVLINVLLNAIEACGGRGNVWVESRVEPGGHGRWCVVGVADSGPGIPADQLAHVFEPFFTTKDSGSGLGLFIARQIMTEHGGAIRVVERRGGGTVFEIRFPAAEVYGDANA